MAGGSAIRGSRVGAGPLGESERGEAAPRRRVKFFCSNGHTVRVAFSLEITDVELPAQWDCPKCGLPAGRDAENMLSAPKNEPYKTHLAYVKERRSDGDGHGILAEALIALRD